jgi:hypothetical protein
LTFGGERCCGPFGAGAATDRQPDRVEPPAAAVLVAEPAAAVLLVLALGELMLPLLPQPATPRTVARRRHALRITSKQTR